MIKEIELNNNAIQIRKHFGEDENSPIDIFSLLQNQNDFTIVLYPMKDNISGLCIKDGQNNIVAINSSLSFGRQRFTLAHELCHLYFHDIDSKYYICHSSFESKKEPQEIEADLFASLFLAPYGSFMEYVKKHIEIYKEISIENIPFIEQYFGISHLATLVRLKKENFISKADYEEMSQKSPLHFALKLGFSDKLYNKTNEKKTYGKYIRIANELIDSDKISNGRYQQYLLDAFREDIIYGSDDNDPNLSLIID